MQKSIINAGFILLLIFSLFSSPLAIRAASSSDRSRIEQLIERTRREISKKRRKEKSVLGNLTKQQQELNKLEKNYDRVVFRLNKVQNKVSITRTELGELQSNLGMLEQSLQKKRNLLSQRLLVTYKYGPQSYLEMLFSGDSFPDLISRFRTVSYIVKNDLHLIGEVEADKVEVSAKKKLVQEKKRQVESELKKVVTLKEEVSDQQQKISQRVKNSREELAKIQKDRAWLEKALEEYEETSREIETEIRRTQHEPSGETLGTGKMIWPVRGRLSSNFGWRYHPVLGRKKYHNGQDIAVPRRTPVHAADAGVVLVSGWQGGYGNFIAIDHGGGISTCYGHNSVLLVQVGERVTKGQQIALSGSTGLSTGPHLHFEVRKNGVPVNPIPYLP